MKFLGTHHVTLDGKNRFLLPKALREKLPEGQRKNFVMARSYDNEKCLRFYTEAEFESTYERDLTLDDKDPDVARFLRLVYGEAMPITLDSSDRVTLPKYFMDLVGISKDVVLTTAGNKLELWDATYYQQYFTANVSALGELSKKMSSGIYNKKTVI